MTSITKRSYGALRVDTEDEDGQLTQTVLDGLFALLLLRGRPSGKQSRQDFTTK